MFFPKSLSPVLRMAFMGVFMYSTADAQPSQPNTGWCTQPSLFYAYEAGVSNRISLQDVTAYNFHNRLMLAAAFRINMNEQRGLGLFSLSAQRIPGPIPWMKFHIEVAHLEFPDYCIGENQLATLVHFLPVKQLVLGVGMGYRSPELSGRKVHSYFDWNHEMNEFYPLFNLSWHCLTINKFGATLFAGNYYYLNFRTLDHLLFGVDTAYEINGQIQFDLRVLTAVKGVSGFVFNVNELQINGGVKICF